MEWTLRQAEVQLRIALRERGRDVAALLDVDVAREVCSDRFRFRASFSAGPPRSWIIDHGPIRDEIGAYGWLGAFARAFDHDCRSLYSRLVEDHLLELEVAPRRAAYIALMEQGAPADVCAQAWHELQMFEEHVRRHHRVERIYSFGVDLAANDDLTVPVFSARGSELTALTVETLRDAQRVMVETMGVPRRYLRWSGGVRLDDEDFTLNPYRDPAAEAKGLALLREWLTPEQRARYDADRCFEVTGSASGKRYRIRHGRQMNIDELDAAGNKVCGWCFLPEGGLVAGDIMLAQKIALETNEKAALKVANRFDAGPRYGRSPGEIDMRPGAVNWVPAMPTRPVVVDSTAWTGLTTTSAP